jgi:hypothetical protein|tara:strand:+ start:765 stop:926 length:162 start_codon:yes stop_codon:yes gene_type:complete
LNSGVLVEMDTVLVLVTGVTITVVLVEDFIIVKLYLLLVDVLILSVLQVFIVV